MKFHTLVTFIMGIVIASSLSASNNKSIIELLENPVIVVLDPVDTDYNTYITHAVENYWTINSYAFVSEDQYNETKDISQNLFLIKSEKQSIEEEGTTVFDKVMKLVYFVKKGKLVNDIAGTPIIIENRTDVKGSVINAVRVLQDKIQFMLYKEESERAFVSYDKNVESRSSIVKVKDLYISRDDLSNNEELSELISLFDGNIHVVSKEELNKLIDSKSPDVYYGVVFTRKTSNVSYINTKQVVSASSGEVIYKDETTTTKPQGFNKKDLKSLAE